MKFLTVNLNFLRGFYIVSGFMLSIIGLGSVGQSLYLQNDSSNQDLWMDKAEDFHQTGYIANIVQGIIELILGGMAIVGVIKRLRKLLLAYNIASLVILMSSLAFFILSLNLISTINDTKCSSYKDFDIIEKYGQDNLCTKNCKCNLLERKFEWFNKETQNRIKQGVIFSKDGEMPENSIFKTQQCPGFPQFLKENNISLSDGEAIAKQLGFIEQQMKCGCGWCITDEIELRSFQFYLFSNINRGPPLTYQGCFHQLQIWYQNYASRFASFNLMVSVIMLFNFIITLMYYLQNRYKKADFIRTISVFDEQPYKQQKNKDE